MRPFGIFTILLLISPALGQTIEWNKDCTDDMQVCICSKEEDACYFQFAVQRLITFTRYLNGMPTGYGGRSYYINDQGELEYLSPMGGPTQYGCSDTNCSQANTVDSNTYRTFIGINGRFPGPTLIVYQGQTVVVDVINMLLTEVTTIHWHGLEQRGTYWMDGAGTVSQCPIEPGTSFTYIFNVSTAGTFWYHSHSGAQRSEGLFGALVVKNDTSAKNYPIEFLDIPEEHTLTLLDWQREESTNLFWKNLAKVRQFSAFSECPDDIPITRPSLEFTRGVDQSGVGTFTWWSGLINGLGKHADVPFKRSILSVFTVERGQTYRFRLIGVQSVYAYRFSIDSHRLTLIATDSWLTEPVVTDYIIIHSGERYDFVVTANQTGDNFWMRAETLEANFSSSDEPAPYQSFPGHLVQAVLHYDGTRVPVGPEYELIPNDPKSCNIDNQCIAVNCPFKYYHPSYFITCINAYQLKLFEETPSDQLPSENYDEQYFLIFGFENVINNTRLRTATINARNFIPYKASPSIQPGAIPESTLCNLDDDCLDGCLCTHQLNLEYNKTVRLVLSSAGLKMAHRRFTHPIHLHGHDFFVVGTGYGTYNDTTGGVIKPTSEIECDPDLSTDVTCVFPKWTNGEGPEISLNQKTIRKDTILVPALGYVIIHFKTTNPGWWFLHCHMEPHQLEGMALTINEAFDMQTMPPAGMQQCGNFSWTVEEFRELPRMRPDSNDPQLSDGTIAGIVIAAIICLIVIVVFGFLLVILCLRSKGKTSNKKKGETSNKGREDVTTTPM